MRPFRIRKNLNEQDSFTNASSEASDYLIGYVLQNRAANPWVTVTPYRIALPLSVCVRSHAFLGSSSCGECVPCQVISVLSGPIRWQVLDMFKTSNERHRIKSILHMYCCGTRKSHPRTRIIRQKRGSAEFLIKLFRSEGGISLSHNNTSWWILFLAQFVKVLRFYMNSVSSA